MGCGELVVRIWLVGTGVVGLFGFGWSELGWFGDLLDWDGWYQGDLGCWHWGGLGDLLRVVVVRMVGVRVEFEVGMSLGWNGREQGKGCGQTGVFW